MTTDTPSAPASDDLCPDCGKPVYAHQMSYRTTAFAGDNRIFHAECGDPFGLKTKDAEITRLRAELAEATHWRDEWHEMSNTMQARAEGVERELATATLAPQEAPIDWQAECDRIYRETGGVTTKLREAYEFYKRTQAAPVAEGKPTSAEINALPQRIRDYIAALETECDPAGTIRENFRLREENAGLRALDKERADGKPDFEKEARALVSGWAFNSAGDDALARIIAEYASNIWTAARASAETEMADAKSDADNARSLAESRRLGKEQAERELATVKAQRDRFAAVIFFECEDEDPRSPDDLLSLDKWELEAIARHRAAKGGE